MKKILISSLALLSIAFCGCHYAEECNESYQANIDYLWCPKVDSAIVKWMPKIEKLASSYKELAECERFENGYDSQHEQLSKCENNSVVGKFILRLIARTGSFRKDSGVVMLHVNIHADSDNGVSSPFQDDVADMFLAIYGCTAYECKNAEKVHVYIKEGVSKAHVLYGLPKEEERVTFDEWLTPENFKIVESNLKSPSESDGYYRYHHFRLNLDSPLIKANIEAKCDSSCRSSWETFEWPLVGK